MKILIDLSSLADNLSGIERFAASISRALVDEHPATYYLVFKDEVHPMFKDIQNNQNIHSVIVPSCKKLLFNQFRLPSAIKRIKADWYLFLAFPVPIFLFKRNMVETIHDICCWDCPETMNSWMKWYFRISHRVALMKCRNIITISNFSKMRIRQRLAYPDSKIWMIYCGIDKEKFRIDGKNLSYISIKYNLPDRYILSLSTLEPRKNLTLLIKAYTDLIQAGIDLPHLVLAGRKGWKMEKALLGIDTRVTERIKFTGFVDDEDLPTIYQNADCFVFPSKYEGFGVPPLEAMSCGTIVLSSDAASLPEVLGNAAIMFRSNDVDDLKAKLLEVYNMPSELHQKYIIQGMQRIDSFDWGAEANKLYNMLS